MFFFVIEAFGTNAQPASGGCSTQRVWDYPNKHFATQKWRLYIRTPCLPQQCVLFVRRLKFLDWRKTPCQPWNGSVKNKVVNHHQEVPFRVLERQYSFDEQGQHIENNGSENMIIHGDNLEALKALLPQYEGKVKCIYIDPPYNTGNEGWCYNDNVSDPTSRNGWGKWWAKRART